MADVSTPLGVTAGPSAVNLLYAAKGFWQRGHSAPRGGQCGRVETAGKGRGRVAQWHPTPSGGREHFSRPQDRFEGIGRWSDGAEVRANYRFRKGPYSARRPCPHSQSRPQGGGKRLSILRRFPPHRLLSAGT